VPRRSPLPGLVAILLGGCAGTELAPPPTAGELDRVAAALLDGIEEPADDAEWRVGDRVLLSIRVERPGRAPLIRLVRATVAEIPREGALEWEDGRREYRDASGALRVVSSGRLGVDLEIFDARGRLLSEGRSDVPERFLREGLRDAMLDLARQAARVREHGGSDLAPAAVLDPFLESWSRFVHGQLALLRLLTRHPGVADLRAEIVDATVDLPSFWSMLFARPRVLRFECGFDRTERGAIRGQPVVGMPIVVSLDDRPVFRYRIEAAPCRPPLLPTAGVMRLEGEHPTEAGRRFTVELLAARRGPVPVPAGQREARASSSALTRRSSSDSAKGFASTGREPASAASLPSR